MSSVDPSHALQVAFMQRLDGATSAGRNVFDRVPPKPNGGGPFPRIVIGEGASSNRRIGNRTDDCYYAGSETTCFVDIYGGRGNEIGHPETKRVADQVRDLLDDAPLDLGAYGHRLEMLEFETATYESDADGITRRALLVFRAWTQALE